MARTSSPSTQPWRCTKNCHLISPTICVWFPPTGARRPNPQERSAPSHKPASLHNLPSFATEKKNPPRTICKRHNKMRRPPRREGSAVKSARGRCDCPGSSLDLTPNAGTSRSGSNQANRVPSVNSRLTSLQLGNRRTREKWDMLL